MSEHQESVGTWGARCAPCEQPWPCRAALTEQLAAQTARAEAAERERDAIRADRDSHQRVGIRMMQDRDAHIAIGQAFVDEINRISIERDALARENERLREIEALAIEFWRPVVRDQEILSDKTVRFLAQDFLAALQPLSAAAAGAGQEGGES